MGFNHIQLQNRRKTRIINVRVSDSFYENLNKVVEAMKEEYGNGITVSEVIRQLATASFILYFKNPTVKDFLMVLSKLYFHKCECGYESFTMKKYEICPKCGARIEGKRVFRPTLDLIKVTEKISLVKLIDEIDKG